MNLLKVYGISSSAYSGENIQIQVSAWFSVDLAHAERLLTIVWYYVNLLVVTVNPTVLPSTAISFPSQLRIRSHCLTFIDLSYSHQDTPLRWLKSKDFMTLSLLYSTESRCFKNQWVVVSFQWHLIEVYPHSLWTSHYPVVQSCSIPVSVRKNQNQPLST